MKDVHDYYNRANAPRWTSPKNNINPLILEQFNEEELQALMDSYKTFDISKDWDAICCDFTCFYNINLFNETMDLTYFNFLLNGLFCKESVIATRICYRAFTRDYNLNPKYNEYMLDMKEQYKL